MRRTLTLILLSLSLLGCKEESTPYTSRVRRPVLPEPTNPLQTTLHERLNAIRKAQGEPEKSLTDDLAFLKSLKERLDARLASLQLNYPPGEDQFFLPEYHPTQAPTPFKLYKRITLDTTDYGMPFNYDVRLFERLSPAEKQALKTWHLSTLESPFSPVPSRFESYLGYGPRDTSIYDPSHGLATQNRAIFVSFIDDGDDLIVLWADGPRATFERHKAQILASVAPVELQ